MLLRKRLAIFLLCAAVLPGSLAAHEWVNDLLVHRRPAYTGENPENCLVCHSGERMRTVSAGVHGNPEDSRAPFGNNGCESCHGPASIHVSRAHGGKGFPPLTGFGYEPLAAPRDQQIAACMYCHGGGENGVEETLFEGTTHDKWIVTCSSCHVSHVEKDPVLVRASQAEICFTCHAEQEEAHQKVGKRVPDFSRMGCAGCHPVHRMPKNKQEP